jgi:hypothetical protein
VVTTTELIHQCTNDAKEAKADNMAITLSVAAERLADYEQALHKIRAIMDGDGNAHMILRELTFYLAEVKHL